MGNGRKTRRSFARYHERLIAACRRAGASVESLGRVGPPGQRRPLLLVRAGAKAGRPICLAFGVHGNEVSGPLGALEFLGRLPQLGRLPRLLILPVMNPWGYEHDKRTDAFGNDLNRRFVGGGLAECRLARGLLVREKPSALLSFHEDDELGRAYFYDHGKNRGSRIIVALKGAAGSCLSRHGKIYGLPAKSGVIRGSADGSLEHAASIWGVPVTVCCEVPDNLPLKRRTALVARMVEAAVGA